MNRELRLFLQDILDAMDAITEFTQGMTFEAFLADRRTRNAVERNLEIIGEATRHVPETIRAQFPEIEWRKSAGMRDRIIHGYFGIDYWLVWETIQTHIPATRPQIEMVLRTVESQSDTDSED